MNESDQSTSGESHDTPNPALSPEARARVQTLLDDDNDEAPDMESLRSIMQVVAALEAPRAPQGFMDRLETKLRKRRATVTERLASSMISLPLQLMCIVVILIGATLKLMSVLEQDSPVVEPAAAGDRSTTDTPREVAVPPRSPAARGHTGRGQGGR